MKLYTEEQVKEIIDIAEFNKHLTHDDILKEFTSIELPSDEEIVELKKENIELKKQLEPFLLEVQKRKDYLERRDKIDEKLGQMLCNFHNQNK